MPAAPAHVAINGAAACPDRTVLLSSPGRIYRVTTDGVLHVIAGNGVTGVNGDGGSALAAQVWPAGPIACDAQGNTIFADNARIRRIDTHGIVTTVAGDGLPVGIVVDGIAAQTPTDTVGAIAVDSGGNIYFSEPKSNRVRVAKPDGTVALFAGAPSTQPADSGDGGPATTASLWSPSFLAVDPTGGVYIAEAARSAQSPRIRKVTPAGVVSTILGGAPSVSAPVDGGNASTASLYSFTSMAIDAGGNLYIGTASYAGVFTAFRIGSDGILHAVPGIAGDVQTIDSAGTVYFRPQTSAGLAALPANGSATAFAGASTSEFPDGTSAINAAIYPSAIAVDASGHLIFAERFTCVIRTLDDAGTLHTLAGTGSCASTVTPGNATAAPLAPVYSIAAGLDGTVYFTSSGSAAYAVFKIDTTGQISSLNQTATTGIAVDGKGALWTAGQTTFGYTPQGGTNTAISGYYGGLFGNIDAIAPIPSGGIYGFSKARNLIYTITSPTSASSGNWYNAPQSAAVTSNGDIWIASNGLFRYASGLGATQSAEIVGAETGMSGDGGSVLSAYFNLPTRLAADSGGVFLMDLNDRRIRRISGAATFGAPSINTGGVVNSANYSPAFFAPGELISIFGSNLAYSTQFATLDNNQIPWILGATAVTANSVAIPLLAVSPGQINAVLPQNIQPGQTQFQVSVDGVLSNTVTNALISAAPALFTADASGKGPGAIVNQDGTVNSAAHPAPRGSIVSLYGTGGGATTPLLPDGYLDVAAPYGLISTTVQVSVGGQAASVAYAGGAPYLINGAFQINVQIPATATAGPADLAVSVGGVPSSHISIYVQ